MKCTKVTTFVLKVLPKKVQGSGTITNLSFASHETSDVTGYLQ